MTNVCLNFVPNVFDKNKCQNCFKSKDNHQAQTSDGSKKSKKVVGCGYLFISPQGLDFRNISDRSKRWQRRFFTLHDDGELVFSIDENSDTIPQGRIHLASCRSVHAGESITGHANSIALHLESGESYFLRAASREEMQHWEKLLVAFSSARVSSQNRIFPRSMSGPLANHSTPQPPPRQQPPRKNFRVTPKRGEYLETDLDYDMGRTAQPRATERSRRRPMSVGDQLKTLIRSGEDDGKELTYLKKGWLFTRSSSDTKLQKRWCVLSDGVLALYRDTLGEEERSPEVSLSLSSSCLVGETCEDMSYGFSVETTSGRYNFTAMTAGIRSNWVAALQTCLRTRRRHTTTVSTASEALSGDMCDAEVSQILSPNERGVSSKTSSVGRSSHTGELMAELYSRLSESETEASGLRSRVADLSTRLEEAERSNTELEAECQRLSTQCQRLELDVVERDKLVSLPTDDELKLQRQLAAHDEALRASQERCLRAERCVTSINDRLAESLSAADEELTAAVRGREEAERDRRAAEADRDAAERRLRTERSHWEAALRQNETENARLAREAARVDVLLSEAAALRQEISRAAPLLSQPCTSHEEALSALSALRCCWEDDAGPGCDLLSLLRLLTASCDDPAARCRQGILLSHLAARLGGSGHLQTLTELLKLTEVAPLSEEGAFLAAVTAALTGDEAAENRTWRTLRSAARALEKRLRSSDAVQHDDSKWLTKLVISSAAEKALSRDARAGGLKTAVEGLVSRLLEDEEEEEEDEDADEDKWQNCLWMIVVTAAVIVRPSESRCCVVPLSESDWEAAMTESRRRFAQEKKLAERNAVLEKEVERLQRLLDRERRESEAKDKHMAAMFEDRQKADEECRNLRLQLQRPDAPRTLTKATNTAGTSPRELSLPMASRNGRRDEEDNTLEFWKAELKQILEEELRMISSPTEGTTGLEADIKALQQKLEEERESHASEMLSLRKQFEAALEEETKATKIAIEAIERNYKEKLETEKSAMSRRQGEQTALPAMSRFANSHATDDKLTLLARKIASLQGRSDY